MSNGDWGGGYVTDIGYIAGFHSIQSQSLMALAALVNNFDARIVGRNEQYRLCDIGCGFGITALITAAANPGWHVTGLDFNPAHIAGARAMAVGSGIRNVTFLEVDLKEFGGANAMRELPEFDAITMHGVWSWVDAEVQAGILRLLNTKLRAGGQFYISYNSAPAWQSTTGLQRVVREAGLRLATRSDAQAQAGFAVARELAAAEGPVTFTEGFGKMMLERFAGLPNAYTAHELMNAHWAPCWHMDVAARMASAKLAFAGSARLLNNFPELTLTAKQRALLGRFDDSNMAELFKEVCHPQLLRNDIYIRGAQRITAEQRDALLGDLTLCLTADTASWTFEFEAAGSNAAMSEDFYRPIFTRLLDGPATVRELLALAGSPGRRNNPVELVGVAIGTEQVKPLANPGTALDERCVRLNSVLMDRQITAGQGGQPIHFAVPSLGGGMTLPWFEGLVIHEISANAAVTNPHEMASRLGARQSEAERVQLAEKLALFFHDDAPLLRHFGFAI